MTNNKSCKGTLYLISGKSHCIGERNANATRKTRTSRKTRTTRKHLKKKRKPKTTRKTRTSKKLKRKNVARGPGDENYDITQCCMCNKTLNVNDKTNALIPLECLRNHRLEAHRICKECWFDEEDGFALEGKSHKCPGCEKRLPLTRVKAKPPEMIDLTLDTDSK
jgi:hypothetical protein